MGFSYISRRPCRCNFFNCFGQGHSGTCCYGGIFRGSLGSFHIVVRLAITVVEHQPDFMHFSKTVSVASADPRELLALPVIESYIVPDATH